MSLARNVVLAVATCVSVVTVSHGATAAAAPSLYGRNLVVNGDAEGNPGADDETLVVRPVGWTTTGQFGVFKFGGISGFPDRNAPGPPHRGSNFFTGGDAPVSTASQTIDVSAVQADIDRGAVHFDVSAWLGGYDAQDDYGTVAATFLDDAKRRLGGVLLGPVTPADRHDRTGFIRRSSAGHLPRGTRAVRAYRGHVRREPRGRRAGGKRQVERARVVRGDAARELTDDAVLRLLALLDHRA